MITYPFLKKGATIGVTAPSSGVEDGLHGLLEAAAKRLTKDGFHVKFGKTAWTQDKARSAPAKERAAEFTSMMQDPSIDLIIPPWGGELLIEMLEYLEFDHLPPKWVLGYSDTSLLLLAITLQTGMATAHGTNLVDLRGEYSDKTTAMWTNVLSTTNGQSIQQHSSSKYQKEWKFDQPTPCVFDLTEPTEWKSTTTESVKLGGRLLGGCIDVIRHIIGTPFGDVTHFRKTHVPDEPLIWYLENCELSTADLRRSLVQMKLAGWFTDCAGILFGRSPANHPVKGYTAEDVYRELADELQIPILYDVDCGHVPPQITFINGAHAEVDYSNGKGSIFQTFLP